MRFHATLSHAAVFGLVLGLVSCRRPPGVQPGSDDKAGPSTSPATPAVSQSTLDSSAAVPSPSPAEIEAAIDRIRETRSSPGGIRTPPELRHYPDTRRFLALQMADAQEAAFTIPHDDAELVQMIRAGKLVRLPPVTDTYLLYEIGEDAKDDPLIHYDAEANKDVPLLPSMEAVEQKKAEWERQGDAKGRSRKAVLETYYGDPARAERLFREYEEVATFARENGYALSDPEDRARLHRDLLSYVRPEARDVMVKIADAYHRQFGRLLPVTSAVRTERYQRRLGGVNPNATRVEIPPHTTGEAFDISYRYMASDEQNFVMDLVARLEDEQKVEALRERLGHIHIYAFAGGDRPPEHMVAAARGFVDAARAEKAEENRIAAKARASKRAKAKAKAKAPVKRTSARATRGR